MKGHIFFLILHNISVRKTVYKYPDI